MATAALSLDNPIFRTFIGYSGAVLAKTCLMSILTSYQRMSNKAFANEEDVKNFNTGSKKLQLVTNDPNVERVRRCHLNDLENAIPFVLLGLIYITTGPSSWAATLHFRIFTISRFIHTFVYLFRVPQPARALAFLAGIAVNFSMAFHIISQGTF